MLNTGEPPADVLTRLYTGPLEAALAPYVAPAGADQGVWLSHLLEPAHLATQLDHFAASYAHGDRRGVASQWSKWHFNAVLVPALVANLLLERELPLAPERLRIVLTQEGRTERIALAHAGTLLPSLTPEQRFQGLIDGHLQPLTDSLAAVSGASPRVFWSNAGNVFEHCLGIIEQHPAAWPGISEPGRRLLESHCLPDGRRNPLYRPVRYLPRETQPPRRVRRLCCIRYLLPNLGYCGNCPLECRRSAERAKEAT